jgi:predicted AAA+ superfamily ATPase
VDLVFEVGKDVFPIEIKYKDTFSKRDLSGLIGFSKKFKTKTSVLVTRDLLKEETENEMKIVYFPAWLFSLLL